MSEALGRVVDFGFGDLQSNRIEALVYPDNAASLKLLERHGFVREGLQGRHGKTPSAPVLCLRSANLSHCTM